MEKKRPYGLEVTSIGSLYRGPWEKKYWSRSRGKDRYPYPVGYRAVRWYNGGTYHMEVQEGPRGPMFVVSCGEGVPCSAETPTIAWQNVLKKESPRAKRIQAKLLYTNTNANGAELFGFLDPLVQRLFRELVASQDGEVQLIDSPVNVERDMEMYKNYKETASGEKSLKPGKSSPAHTELCWGSTRSKRVRKSRTSIVKPGISEPLRRDIELGMFCKETQAGGSHEKCAFVQTAAKRKTQSVAGDQENVISLAVDQEKAMHGAEGRKCLKLSKQARMDVEVMPLCNHVRDPVCAPLYSADRDFSQPGVESSSAKATAPLQELLSSDISPTVAVVPDSLEGYSTVGSQGGMAEPEDEKDICPAASHEVDKARDSTEHIKTNSIQCPLETHRDHTQETYTGILDTPDKNPPQNIIERGNSVVIQSYNLDLCVKNSTDSENCTESQSLVGAIFSSQNIYKTSHNGSPSPDVSATGFSAERLRLKNAVVPDTYDFLCTSMPMSAQNIKEFDSLSAEEIVLAPKDACRTVKPISSENGLHVVEGSQVGEGNTERGESDSLGQELTKSMITLLLPQAVGLLNENKKKSKPMVSVQTHTYSLPNAKKDSQVTEAFDICPPDLHTMNETTESPTMENDSKGMSDPLVLSSQERSDDDRRSLLVEESEQNMSSVVHQLSLQRDDFEPKVCLQHPLPVIAMKLNAEGECIHLFVCCGIKNARSRILFVYELVGQELNPLLIGSIEIEVLDLPPEAVNMGLPLEETGIQFTSDGQELVLLDVFSIGQARDAKQETERQGLQGGRDIGGIRIISYEGDEICTYTRINSDKHMYCLLLPMPYMVVAAGERGCVSAWIMDSNWRTCKESFTLPIPTCEGYTLSHVICLLSMPNNLHLVIGCDNMGTGAIWNVLKCEVLSTFKLGFPSILEVHALKLGTMKQHDDKDVSDTTSSMKNVCLLVSTLVCKESLPVDFAEGIMKYWSLSFLNEAGCATKLMLDQQTQRISTVKIMDNLGVAGTEEGYVYLWDLITGSIKVRLNELKGVHIISIAAHLSPSMLAIAGIDNCVVLYKKQGNN